MHRGDAPSIRQGWPRLLSCAVLTGALASAAAPTAAVGASLRPDEQPFHHTAVRLCQEGAPPVKRCTGTGRIVLRLSTKVGNYGKGPLELTAVPPAQDVPEDCHGDGDIDMNGDGVPDDNDVLVRQVIYNDVNGDGAYEPSVDTSATTRIAGCRYYHPEHHHYHLDGFATYQVQSVQTGRVVRTSGKVSFCIEDTGYFDLSLPGAPRPSSSGAGHYDGANCAARGSVQGSSIGWYDLYGWALPGQDVDITGLAAGDYCVITRVDPGNQLLESNETNNDDTRRFHIDPATAPRNSYLSLKQASGGCPPIQ